MGFQDHPSSVQMGHSERSFLREHLDLDWILPLQTVVLLVSHCPMEKHNLLCGIISPPALLEFSIFHMMGVSLPSMAPRTLAWGWFEPSWWLEGFLEDRTHNNDMAFEMGDEVVEHGGKKRRFEIQLTLIGILALPLTS